ncbi:MAG: hypothetical protein GXO83_07455 [Chlorobi bacterium]|nr:hypothetical protein [Chlorobiota bacterium]
MVHVQSHEEFLEKIKDQEKAYLLLYKEGSDISRCAVDNIRKAAGEQKEFVLYAADVSKVRDIHPVYHVTTAPTLLAFEGGKLKNTYKGCNDAVYYKTLFESIIWASTSTDGKKPVKRVVVYSTPTCSWCNTLKSYLRKNNIPFRDVDVSRNKHAAEELVRRTGQQGVPQTEINGQWVVGFDQKKLDRLLEIEN